jgi:serine/threonine protein kinase
MDRAERIGQILDDKYRIERELGRGGMGTVYLATHLGTERPVAVKVIAPQYMQRAEFVERFRREARAAGRLRHPNVVDVTDFGFSDTSEGTVAYLVMEYLDGCTLGEILEEEKRLPLGWTLDILDQVCSAVHEAHSQGIIHRDLKPDNIWLEPNQRGGYTVKVLDFGIAKLEETVAHEAADPAVAFAELQGYAARSTFASADDATIAIDRPATVASDGATIAQTPGRHKAEPLGVHDPDLVFSESSTAIITTPGEAVDQDTVGTQLISDPLETDRSVSVPLTPGGSLIDGQTTGDLTRVGAVLGTPLYMSPEQCRGEKLDARSDVYSLGVIAHQMLSGSTPFNGDFADVMRAHNELVPPPIQTKGIRRNVKKVILQALEKEPDKRPQSAEAFSGVLRSQSEGIFALLRRALVIYSEHLPKFLGLAGIYFIPVIIFTLILVGLSFLRISEMLSPGLANTMIGVMGFLQSVATAFLTYLIFGTITWVVAQYLAVPLRPVRIRPAMKEARRRWKSFAWTGFLGTLAVFAAMIVAAIAGFLIPGVVALIIYFTGGNAIPVLIVGAVICGIAGLTGFLSAHIFSTLFTPVVMMENRSGIAAIKRSVELVRRSFITAAAAAFITFLIPAIVAGSINYIIVVSGKAFFPKPSDTATVSQQQPADSENQTREQVQKSGITFSPEGNRGITFDVGERDIRTKAKETVQGSLFQLIWLPVHIFVTSFSAIMFALLYLKTRQAGGECTAEFLAKFEEAEPTRKRWQERVRQRLIQSGRATSKPT